MLLHDFDFSCVAIHCRSVLFSSLVFLLVGCGYVDLDLASDESLMQPLSSTSSMKSEAPAPLVEDELTSGLNEPRDSEVDDFEGIDKDAISSGEGVDDSSRADQGGSLGAGGNAGSDDSKQIDVCDESCVCDDQCQQQCSGARCESSCGVDAECLIDAKVSSVLMIDCQEGASCTISGVQAPNFQTQCFGEGSCEADCGDADACEMQCINGGRCELDCKGLAACTMVCDWGSSCILSNSQSAGMICTDPGVLKDCGQGIWTCNAACPGQ